MRILITGGTGFIGSNLALTLRSEGHDVLITGSMYEQQLPEFANSIIYSGLTGIDWERVGAVDALFHQGAISDTRILDEKEMLRANVETSRIVFGEALARGAHTIVYASSTAVYGNLPAPFVETMVPAPQNPYGVSKAALDTYAMEFAIEHPEVRVVGLRYCNVYGPRENHKRQTASMIYQCAQQMLKGNPKLFKFGEQLRDYTYVADVVRANICALTAKKSCVVNCGSGTATSYNDVVTHLNEVLGLSRTPAYIENPYASRYQTHTLCDMHLAQELLDFVPQYGITRGIQEYYDSGYLV